MRAFKIFEITEEFSVFKQRILYWANKHSNFAFLDSNQNINNKLSYNSFDCMLGVDVFREFSVVNSFGFEYSKNFLSRYADWWFGYFSYDLKNEIENLTSTNSDGVQFPELHFFQPRFVFIINKTNLEIGYLPKENTPEEIETIMQEIFSTALPDEKISPTTFNRRFSKEEYIETVNKIKTDIQNGEIYELNFCQEFYCDNAEIEPISVFIKLINLSPTPFACLYKLDDKFLLSASPERFIKKTGSKIISQPMKGTIQRGFDEVSDNEMINKLKNDSKEIAENTMIVDLVRNDLSRTAKKGSVEVEELCGIHSFKQVHQMVSTVTAQLDEEFHIIDAIKYAFPMGSMTGMPKVRAMQLIEEYERTKRGLYSGSVGYISPQDDFDFNVIIRSLLYNKRNKYLSFQVGGAITSKSIPENEYNECLLKAKAIMQVFQTNIL